MFEAPIFQPVLLTLNNIKKKFENFQRHWQVNPIPRGVDSSLLFDPRFFLFSFVFFYIIVLFLRRRVHINKKYRYSLLSFIQERQVRGKCETAWSSQIGSFSESQLITFVQITCTFFLKKV